MFVPPVRAAVLEFIQIGIVRIFPAPVESPVPTIETPRHSHARANLIFLDSSFGDKSAGETTLENAQRNIVDFPSHSQPIPLTLVSLTESSFRMQAAGWSFSSGLTRSSLIMFK